MEFAMSSSPTFEPPSPSILLRSQTTSPQRSRANISTQRSSQRSRSDIFSSLPPPPAEMDLSSSVPSLHMPTQTPSNQDSPMLDGESAPNEHLIDQGIPPSNLQQELVAGTGTEDTPVEQNMNGSMDNVEQTSQQEEQRSTEIVEGRLDDNNPEQNSSPAETGQPSTIDILVAIVNAPFHDGGDAMEVAEPETSIAGHQNAHVDTPDNQPSTGHEGMASQSVRSTSPTIASPESTSAAPHGPQDPANQDEPDYSETSSDCGSDDDSLTREDFVEDTSTPDEEELKEIESQVEIAGTDHEYFEKEFFHDLDDPEHVPGDVHRIHWTVTNVRGTWEHPNKEAVMRSPSVRIGDLDWNIKFYPKGNNTDHISVYIEASKPKPMSTVPEDQDEPRNDAVAGTISMEDSMGERDVSNRHPLSSAAANSENPSPPSAASQSRRQSETMADTSDVHMSGSEETTPNTDGENSEDEDDDWEVAAQFGIVLYNPSEPRVHVSQGIDYRLEHRFCSSSADWGCTRFYGPQEALWKRQRGQRQALLRNDTLAFTAYVRIIKDDTQTLFLRSADPGAWDSLAKTGLRSLSPRRPEESFVVAAIASWALLAPFREIIHSVPTADPLNDRTLPPKGLVIALQRVLHRLQTQQKPSSSPVLLAPITNFLRCLGFYPYSKYDVVMYDVVEFWELLRARLEEELEDTAMNGRLSDLLDGSLQRESTKIEEGAMDEMTVVPVCAGRAPSLRLPVKGVKSVQEAFAKFLDGDDSVSKASWRKLPKLMHVELERQVFDESSRKWEKYVDRVKVDETIDLAPWTVDPDVESQYTLYGVIVHDRNLRSCRYHPVLRPGGPGTRWYSYLRENETDKVVCQTRKQAIQNNEGVDPDKERDGFEPVAYVVMYVRKDMVGELLQGLPEQPLAPQWIRDESDAKVIMDPWTDEVYLEYLAKEMDVRIYRSDLFKDNSGVGVFDLYKASPRYLEQNQIIDLKLPGRTNITEVRKELASIIGGIENPRQCQLFRFDALSGALARPDHRVVEATSLSKEKLVWPQMQYWLHIVPQSSIMKGVVTDTSLIVSTSDEVTSRPGESLAGNHSEATPSIFPNRPTENEPPRNTNDERVEDLLPISEDADRQESENQATDSNAHEDSLMPDAPDTLVMNDRGEIEAPRGEMNFETSQPSTLATATVTAPELSQLPWTIGNAWDAPQHTRNEATSGTREVIYLLLKRFNPKEQSLRGVGGYIVRKDDSIAPIIRNLLELPEEYRFKLLAEEPDNRVQELTLEGSFRDHKLSNGSIVVVQDEISDEELRRIREEGGFDSLSGYLSFCCRLNEGIHPLEGFITHKYFSNDASCGQTKNGQWHGPGTFTDFNGDTYEGNFVAGRRDGKGRQHFQNHDVYEGDWKDDRMDGQGTMVYAKTGNTYVGGFKAGRRHGRGRMEYLVAEDEQQLCQICYEEDIDCLFYDCGHVCACIKCAKQLENCPVCRKAVRSAVKMYRS